MRLCMTLHAQPAHIERLGIVRMMRLDDAYSTAHFTPIGTVKAACGNGILHSLPRLYLLLIAFSCSLPVFANALWMSALPVQHTQSISLAVVLAPVIAASLRALRVVGLPLFGIGDGARLTPRCQPMLVTTTFMELRERLFRLTRTAIVKLHGIIIARNHFSIAHGGRK